MNNEEKFKDRLKNLLDSKEFEFDESNWEKASELIDKNKKKRRSVWPYFLLLGVFIGSAFTYLLLDTDEPVITQAIQVPVMPKQSTTIAPASPAPTRETNVPVVSKKIKQVERQPITAAAPSEITKQNTIADQKVEEETTITKTENITTTATEETPSSPTPPASEEVVVKTPPVVPESKSDVIADKPVDNIIPTPLVAVTVPVVKENEKTEEKKIDAEAELTQLLPITEEISAKSNPETLVTTNPEVAVASPTTVPEVAANADQHKPEPETKSNLLSIEAGTSYQFGWNSNGTTEARGFNPIIGLNYHNKINNELDYSLGVHFTTLAHLSAFSDTSKITTYKYGEENDVTVITPKSLYYVTMPFRISKNFNKNTFGLAANFSYLITSNSTVETYHQSLTASNQNTGKEKGYTEGFAEYNIELGLMYRRKLYKNLSLNTEFVFGLTDLKNNEFFNTSLTERSSGIKLTLLYGIITR